MKKLFLVGLFAFASVSSFATECNGSFDLDNAVREGRLQKVKKILAQGSLDKSPACLGRALLEIGDLEGRKKLKIARLLIQAGADLNYFDESTSKGTNAVIEAIHAMDFDTLALLADSGADLKFNLAGKSNFRTALYTAIIYKNSLELATYLLDKGVDPDQQLFSCRDSNVLNELIWSDDGFGVDHRKTNEMVLLLLKNGANPNHRTKVCGDIRSWSILESAKEIARRNGNTELVELLIQHGAK